MQFYETIPVKILLQKLPAKILAFNQITGLFDHQYLWDPSINVLYFLGDSYEVTVVLRIILVYFQECLALRKKCPNTELFLVCIFLYSVRKKKIRTRKNSVFGHFSPSIVTSKPVTATYTKSVFG